jgi:hypothetical protein
VEVAMIEQGITNAMEDEGQERGKWSSYQKQKNNVNASLLGMIPIQHFFVNYMRMINTPIDNRKNSVKQSIDNWKNHMKKPVWICHNEQIKDDKY